nr:hypothetical protein [Butyrivibrio sp.]
MRKIEAFFDKYGLENLTLKLILCYAIGYIFSFAPVGSGILNYLTLNPYEILHGQVWRIVTWILVPPSESNIFFVLIMLYFYYSIGSTMERVWGKGRYNAYIFNGMLLMVIGAMITFVVSLFVLPGILSADNASYIYAVISSSFSTYYINMSILLAFAATFPDNVVLFMFVIPLKVKYLGIIYGIWLGIEGLSALFGGAFWQFIAIAASLLNFFIFWFFNGRHFHFRPKEVKRRTEFKRAVKMTPPGVAKHKCAVCGKTEIDDPNMQFRFC